MKSGRCQKFTGGKGARCTGVFGGPGATVVFLGSCRGARGTLLSHFVALCTCRSNLERESQHAQCLLALGPLNIICLAPGLASGCPRVL